MRVFEAQKQHNEEAERLRDTEASRGREVERYAAQLTSSKEELERLGLENQKMSESIQTLASASEIAMKRSVNRSFSGGLKPENWTYSTIFST